MTTKNQAKPKVFITRSLQFATTTLEQLKNKYDIVIGPDEYSCTEMMEFLKDSNALLLKGHFRVDKEIIDAAPKLKVIATHGVGFDSIDVNYATFKKIWVCNTPDVLSAATADLAMALLLNISRRMSEAERWLRQGNFANGFDVFIGNDPEGKVLGIAGMGRIGKQLAKRAAAFDMKIIYYNRRRLSEEEEQKCGNAKFVSKTELLQQSDYISLHLPASSESFHFLDSAEFTMMKNGVYIINTCRGTVINEQALVDALKLGKVRGAGLDVFEHEPHSIHPELLRFPNVCLTPHIGSASAETRRKMEELSLQNIDRVLSGEKPNTPVNKIM